jgi:hypothetical protein
LADNYGVNGTAEDPLNIKAPNEVATGSEKVDDESDIKRRSKQKWRAK